jgi:UDP-N-acetylmuramoyl-tripeptide--D-alanyl-D-alanine ligase
MKVNDCLKAIDGELVSGVGDKVFRGVSIDSRTLKENELFICIHGDRFDGHDFIEEAKNKKASAIVLSDVSKSIPKKSVVLSVIRVGDTLKALQELARFHRKQIPVQVVGITGTNGKSTTKEMIASITDTKLKTIKTKGNMNNHIGLPLIASVATSRSSKVTVPAFRIW